MALRSTPTIVPSNGPHPAADVTVLVADDSEMFRRVAADVIGATAGFVLVGTARSGEEAVELAAELGPGLALVDVRMPGIGGVEAARRIAERGSAALVVLVSSGEQEDAPGASASGLPYLSKSRLGPAALRSLWSLRRGR